jgi:hypothetical protein
MITVALQNTLYFFFINIYQDFEGMMDSTDSTESPECSFKWKIDHRRL